jgi:hypothetical protein
MRQYPTVTQISLRGGHAFPSLGLVLITQTYVLWRWVLTHATWRGDLLCRLCSNTRVRMLDFVRTESSVVFLFYFPLKPH